MAGEGLLGPVQSQSMDRQCHSGAEFWTGDQAGGSETLSSSPSSSPHTDPYPLPSPSTFPGSSGLTSGRVLSGYRLGISGSGRDVAMGVTGS